MGRAWLVRLRHRPNGRGSDPGAGPRADADAGTGTDTGSRADTRDTGARDAAIVTGLGQRDFQARAPQRAGLDRLSEAKLSGAVQVSRSVTLNLHMNCAASHKVAPLTQGCRPEKIACKQPVLPALSLYPAQLTHVFL